MDKQEDKRVLKDRFRKRVEGILNELLERNGVEIFGDLKIEVANMDTPALIKGNRIYIDVSLAKYPKYILKYVIAHELAHLIVKRHSKKFWEIVKRIYPQYERGKNELLKRTY